MLTQKELAEIGDQLAHIAKVYHSVSVAMESHVKTIKNEELNDVLLSAGQSNGYKVMASAVLLAMTGNIQPLERILQDGEEMLTQLL